MVCGSLYTIARALSIDHIPVFGGFASFSILCNVKTNVQRLDGRQHDILGRKGKMQNTTPMVPCIK